MRGIRSAAIVLALSVAIAGCSDLPTTPTAPGDDVMVANSLTGALQNAISSQVQLVTVLTRSVPLLLDESVTQVIGPSGGTISLPLAGFEFEVPAGALSEPTAMTVTAPAGNLVGYHFAPHGLQFLDDASGTQSLSLLNAPRNLKKVNIFAAYFEGPLQSQVESSEIIDIRQKRGVLQFPIAHFSGYVIATD